jgi:REP-associated tyrosine transposase
VGEYRRSAHAVTDLKYHLIWVTKYRYKILRGDIAERARDLIRQICVAREVTIIRGAVSPDHVHMLVGAPPQLAHRNWCNSLKGDRRGCCSGSSPRCASAIGGSICGRGATTARVSARWTNRPFASMSRTSGGTRMSIVVLENRVARNAPAKRPGRGSALTGCVRGDHLWVPDRSTFCP